MSAEKRAAAEPPILLVDRREGVATLTLNRPQVLNALNHEQRGTLIAAFADLSADSAVNAIVLGGAGRAFCAGQDQRESGSMDAQGAERRIADYARLYDAIRRTEKPVIARLHGYAAGAGFQLALLADLRIAARTTKVGMTELKVGSAAILGSALLRAIAGEAAMKRLVLMADFISAQQALGLGLVHEVVDDDRLDEHVGEVAAALAKNLPTATRLTKAWWRLMSEEQFAQAVEEAHRAHAANFATGDLSAGARRFAARKERAQP